jgi:hypothetical protein
VLDDSTTYTSSTIKEYRYTGANPNNYIYYNCTDLSDVSTCEVWRILGIYNVNNESRIKIINTNSNTSYAWDTNGGSSFNTSTLNSYLNGDYYNSLSTDARNQIENATYYLGGADSLDINSKEMYGDEKTATEYISTNVGLMTLSDYSFASGINDTTLISGISSLNASNWLYKGLDEWLINKDSSGAVYYIASDGSISTGTVTSEYLIRPVVYLASNIKITGGNGSSASPYQLSK